MAVIYLRSTDGNNADDGSTWALAKATLAAALTAAGAGGTVYMSHVHAETSASNPAPASPGTAASPVRVLCVNDGAEPPTALATTGSVSTTGANNITWNGGFTYVYGVTVNLSDSTSGANFNFTNVSDWWARFEDCTITFRGTAISSELNLGAVSASSNSQLVEFRNCTIKFGNVNNGIVASSRFTWIGGTLDGSVAVPTSLIKQANGTTGHVLINGVDLSAAGSGNNLVENAGSTTSNDGSYTFVNCKLGASVALSTGTHPGQGGSVITLVNCDSADTNYRYAKKVYQGDITHEATIVRTGGASDGTTSISRKMVTTANSKFYSPLEMDPIVIWNESTSSLTVTVHIVTDNVTLTDAECWIEVEELGTSGYPLSVTQSDRAADILATPANQTTSTETWTTTGLGTPVYQKLNVTFTPAEKGPIKVRVMLAKASTTVYVCPKVEVS